jgi:hypothetical protein
LLAALAAAAVVCAAALLIGHALLRAAGRREWSPIAAAVGFAALLVLCGLGGRVVVLLAAVLVATGWLVASGHVGGQGRGASGEKSPTGGDKSPHVAVGAALLAASGAFLPFLVNDRIGVLGAGLVNDDMANHLLMADWAQNGTEPRPELVDDGYPLGPHSLAATLADLLGTGLVEAFAGITIAIAALAAITALAALDRLPPLRRTAAAALAALPYLGAAYLVQGAFKEPIQALLLVGFVLLLARLGDFVPGPGTKSTARAVIPLGILTAATIYNYSFPGLFWLAGAAAVYLAILHLPRPGDAVRALARNAMPIAMTVGVALLLTIPEWGRIVTFTGFGAFDPAGEQTGLGNLRQALSPLEALGVWPTGEFRLSPADAALPAPAFYLAGLLGAAAVGVGVAVALRRRRDEADGTAILAAFVASAVIYAGAAIAGTPYTSAKALAIAAVPAMLLPLRALLSRGAISSLLARRPRLLAPAATVFALAFVLAAAASSFLALRQAPVSVAAHPDELADIRPLVAGDPVLFLGRDDFIAWHLRGAPVSTHIRNFFSTGKVPAAVDPEDGEKFDFDAVAPETLDRFPYVLTTSSAYASEPPANFELVERTPSYALWERTGPTPPRSFLGEGTAPGAVPPCAERPDAREFASWLAPPVEGPESAWKPSATIGPGEGARQSIELGKGTWELSLAYDSPRPITLRISGPGVNQRLFTLPGNLDFRGPTPPFPAGDLDLHHRGAYEVEATLAEAPLAGRLLGAEGEAHLRGLFAVDTSAPIEHSRGRPPCDVYVDWFLRQDDP